jgi:hypothetical protein
VQRRRGSIAKGSHHLGAPSISDRYPSKKDPFRTPVLQHERDPCLVVTLHRRDTYIHQKNIVYDPIIFLRPEAVNEGTNREEQCRHNDRLEASSKVMHGWSSVARAEPTEGRQSCSALRHGSVR